MIARVKQSEILKHKVKDVEKRDAEVHNIIITIISLYNLMNDFNEN